MMTMTELVRRVRFVLCRECDHWNDWDSVGEESLGNLVCSCAHWSGEGYVVYTGPDDFCSYGEPREEADHETD